MLQLQRELISNTDVALICFKAFPDDVAQMFVRMDAARLWAAPPKYWLCDLTAAESGHSDVSALCHLSSSRCLWNGYVAKQ